MLLTSLLLLFSPLISLFSPLISAVKITASNDKQEAARIAQTYILPYINLPYGIITVGSPAREYKVMFATGFSNIILPGANCKSGACIAHKSYDAKLSTTSAPVPNGSPITQRLGSRGSVKGGYIKDKVCLGALSDMCLNQMPFLVADEMSSLPFDLAPYDGIFGLGLAAKENSAFNPLTLYAKNNVMKMNQFGVWLAQEGDEEQSSISFGGGMDDKMASKVYWTTVLHPAKQTRWEVGLSEIVINPVERVRERLSAAASKGNEANETAIEDQTMQFVEPADDGDLEDEGVEVDTSSSSDGVPAELCGQNEKCRAVLDSTSPLILLPKDKLAFLKTKIGISDQELADCQRNANLPNIGFKINGVIFSLEPSDYVAQGKGACVYKFQALEGSKSSGAVVYLGAPFLQKYATLYDRDTLQVGLALAAHTSLGNANELILQDSV